jgi:hypothetical protein
VAFPPDTSGGNEYEACNSHTQEMISCEQRNIGERARRRSRRTGRFRCVVVEDERERVRG